MPAEAAAVSAKTGRPRPVANAAAVPMVAMACRLVITLIVCSLVRQNGLGRSSRNARSLKRAFKIALLNLLPFGLPWQRKPFPEAPSTCTRARTLIVNRPDLRYQAFYPHQGPIRSDGRH